ncbi:MAG: lamin tail domain-containing protein [Myxococcales bacterium]|jgi:hypothetical protein
MRLRLTLLSTLTVLALAGCPGEEECTGPDCEPSACSPACSGSTPICDEATKTCKACTEDKGCEAGKVCDTSVAKGQCVDCTSDSHCADPTPICDLEAKACVVCTAYYGCPTSDYCDTSYPGGRCVKTSTGCSSSSECSGATPVCNTVTRECVVCTATEGCGVGEVCNTLVAGGRCDPVSTGCTSSAQCSSPTSVCDTSSGKCVVCTATEGCEEDEVCNTSVPGGRCDPMSTGCTSSAQCSSPTPVCDTQTQQCVVCTPTEGCEEDEVCNTLVAGGRCDPKSTGCTDSNQCSSPTPVCNTQTQQCVVCTATEGCGGSTPKCNTAVAGGQCVQCLASADCAATPATPICSPNNICVAEEGSASDQIAAARATADGTNLSLPIHGALVTYVKEAIGNDPAGFVLQADREGPAIFLKVDPTSLTPPVAVGDKVNLTVTALDSSVSSIKMATAITGYARVSAGNPVTTLVQDLSSAADIVSNLGGYECELIRLSGTVAGPFAYGGSGHQSAPFSTTGVPNDSNLKVRLAQTLKESLGLDEGCSFTINYGVMWRHNAQAQPSAYSTSEITNIDCPAPTVVSARAVASTQITITFDREIDPASVLANGSQFTFTGGLTATSASVTGTIATVNTSPQGAGTQYTVTVASTVLDVSGRGVSSAQNSATFSGFDSSAGSEVVISQLYVGGGSSASGTAFKHDFVELHNRSSSAVDLSTWSFQYSSASGSNWQKVNLTGSIAPGGFYLVQTGSAGQAGDDLPLTPDAVTSSLSMGGTNGKVALVRSQTALSGACPLPSADVADFVGYGTASCYEGSAAAASPSSTSMALFRAGNGCADSDDNLLDFAEATPAPRNSTSAAVSCP